MIDSLQRPTCLTYKWTLQPVRERGQDMFRLHDEQGGWLGYYSTPEGAWARAQQFETKGY